MPGGCPFLLSQLIRMDGLSEGLLRQGIAFVLPIRQDAPLQIEETGFVRYNAVLNWFHLSRLFCDSFTVN